MKQFWLLAAAGLMLVTLLPNDAFAQRGIGPRMGGGGIGGGFRGAAIGPRIGGGGGGGVCGAAPAPRFARGGVSAAPARPRLTGARVSRRWSRLGMARAAGLWLVGFPGRPGHRPGSVQLRLSVRL